MNLCAVFYQIIYVHLIFKAFSPECSKLQIAESFGLIDFSEIWVIFCSIPPSILTENLFLLLGSSYDKCLGHLVCSLIIVSSNAVLKIMGQTKSLFVYFCPFSKTMTNMVQHLSIKSIDCVLGIRTQAVGW